MSDVKSDVVIKTGMSQVFWCKSANGECEMRQTCPEQVGSPTCEQGKVQIEAVKSISFGGTDYKCLSWMDWLLEGGFHLPESQKPLLILISGPPGSGKTTFALELCYRLASKKYASKADIENESPLLPLYLSGDTEATDLVSNAVKLGWKDLANLYVTVKPNESNDRLQGKIEGIIGGSSDLPPPRQPVLLWGKSDLPKPHKPRTDDDRGVTITFTSALSEIFEVGIKVDANKLSGWIEILSAMFPTFSNQTQIPSPEILVLDSLNIFRSVEEKDFDFMDLYAKLKARPANKGKPLKIVVVVADSRYEDKQSKHMAYLADVVIRLDYDSNHDYFTRYIEIEKTRFQGHVLGRHYFKILGPYSQPETNTGLCNENILIQRSHPYRQQGGIFICPSIHSYLSAYRKRSVPPPTGDISAFTGEIPNEVLKFPQGRCTTFIGDRGAHKSHFAYAQLLAYLKNQPSEGEETGAIVVSLREDDKKTRQTLKTILSELSEKPEKLDDYINKNRLLILHYLPGYITPNEFIHRLFLAVHQLKWPKNQSKQTMSRSQNTEDKRARRLMLVFNSLDQITPRLPLCTKEDMFVAAIVEFLLAESVTSIFITGEDPFERSKQYGILPMSDLIMSFFKYFVPKRDVSGDLTKSSDDCAKSSKERREITLLRVEKIAGGINAGKMGILELVDSEESKRTKRRTGLHFKLWDHGIGADWVRVYEGK